MTELKITIDQLKNYLDTGLKATFESDEHEHDFVGLDLTGCGIHLISAFGDFGSAWIKDLRPICYRLSDLDKFIPELRFVPLDELYFEAGHQRPAQNNGGMMLWNKSMFETILHAIPFRRLL